MATTTVSPDATVITETVIIDGEPVTRPRRNRRGMWRSVKATRKKYARRASRSMKSAGRSVRSTATKARVKTKRGWRATVRQLSRAYRASRGFIVRSSKWGWRKLILPVPRLVYRGAGFLLRGASWVVQGLLGLGGLVIVGAIIVGSALWYVDRAYDRQVHRRVVNMSRGKRLNAKRRKSDKVINPKVEQVFTEEFGVPENGHEVVKGEVIENKSEAKSAQEPKAEVKQERVARQEKVQRFMRIGDSRVHIHDAPPRVDVGARNKDIPYYPLVTVIHDDGETDIGSFNDVNDTIRNTNDREEFYDLLAAVGPALSLKLWENMGLEALNHGLTHRGAYYYGRVMAMRKFIDANGQVKEGVVVGEDGRMVTAQDVIETMAKAMIPDTEQQSRMAEGFAHETQRLLDLQQQEAQSSAH